MRVASIEDNADGSATVIFEDISPLEYDFFLRLGIQTALMDCVNATLKELDSDSEK